MIRIADIAAFLGIVLLIGLSACGSAKKLPVEIETEHTLTSLISVLDTAYSMPEWVSCKARIHFESEYQRFQFTSYIRMRSDSVIWFNARKLGIEVARGLITKDSVFVLDRFGNTYVREGIAYMSSKYHLPLDFRGFQKLVMGHPDTLHHEMKMVREKDAYALSNSRDHQSLKLLIDSGNLQLNDSYWMDLLHAQSLTATFSDHTRISSYNFPMKRGLSAHGTDFDDFSLDITFTNVELDTPKNIKFEIPAHYDRIRP